MPVPKHKQMTHLIFNIWARVHGLLKEFSDICFAKFLKSDWASPLHMVPKPGAKWRPCGDFRRLNTATKPNHYVLLNIKDFVSNLSGKKIFSTIDLRKGYIQLKMDPKLIKKTPICTPFGTYKFLRLPFGVCNATATFQCLMDKVLGDLPFVFVYLDDLLIASNNKEEHISHPREVFNRLRANGLAINPNKCM